MQKDYIIKSIYRHLVHNRDKYCILSQFNVAYDNYDILYTNPSMAEPDDLRK